MLKYGMYAKAVELLFYPAVAALICWLVSLVL